MKAAAAAAVKSWVEQLYSQEVVTTKVDTVIGKIDTDEGMPILDYWIRWQERGAMDTRRRPTHLINR